MPSGFYAIASTLKRPVTAGSTITFKCTPVSGKSETENYIKIGEYNGGTWVTRQHINFDGGTVTFTLGSTTTAIVICMQSHNYTMDEFKTLLAGASLTGTTDDSKYGSFDPSKYTNYGD